MTDKAHPALLVAGCLPVNPMYNISPQASTIALSRLYMMKVAKFLCAGKQSVK